MKKLEGSYVGKSGTVGELLDSVRDVMAKTLHISHRDYHMACVTSDFAVRLRDGSEFVRKHADGNLVIIAMRENTIERHYQMPPTAIQLCGWLLMCKYINLMCFTATAGDPGIAALLPCDYAGQPCAITMLYIDKEPGAARHAVSRRTHYMSTTMEMRRVAEPGGDGDSGGGGGGVALEEGECEAGDGGGE